MNKKLQTTKFGLPQHLQLVQAEAPAPGPGEVVIRVEASSLAFTDTLLRRGIYPGMKKTLPLTPGYDLVGLIERVGLGVNDWQPGDRVAALTITGANADLVTIAATELMPVPDALPAAEAESLLLSWVTAWQMLFRIASVKKGDTVLVHGAAGGVGHALVQLAVLHGINVVATSRRELLEEVSKHGVNRVLDYASPQLWSNLSAQKFDAVFDGVSLANFKKSYRLLKTNARLVCFGFSAVGKSVTGTSASITLKGFLMVLKTLAFIATHKRALFYDIKRHKATHPQLFKEDAGKLFLLLQENKIAPQVSTVQFGDINAIRNVHQLLTDGGVSGRWTIVH